MQKLNPEIPSMSAPKYEANEGARISIRDPDTILTTIVLLIACLALAVLAHTVI